MATVAGAKREAAVIEFQRRSTPSASAGQPAKLVQEEPSLEEMNKASMRAGAQWTVVIFDPRVEEYEYKWQGQKRKGTNLVCNIVSLKDQRHYCQGRFRKTQKTGPDFDTAAKKYIEGGTFVMSEVVSVDNARPQYNNAPMKVVVDLNMTKMEAAAASTRAPSAVQPALLQQPKMSSIGDVHRWLAEEHVATCTNTDAQRIREAGDVLRSAPMPSQKDVRPLQSKWQVPQTTKDKKARPLPDVIQDLKSRVVEAAQELQRQLAGSAVQPAPTTAVSKCLELHADQLFDVTALVKSCHLPQEHHGRHNISSLLMSICDGSLDETTQLRLFFDTDKPQRGQNFLQVCTEAMAANEAVTILCIKGSHNAAGDVSFVGTSYTRVVKANSDGPKAAELNAKAMLRNLTDEAMTLQTIQAVLSLSDSKTEGANDTLPATLDMIVASDHHTMAVKYCTQAQPAELDNVRVPTEQADAGETLTRPCSQVIALIAASEASRMQDMGTGEYKLVTNNVVDATFPEIAGKGKFAVTSYCNLQTCSELKLNAKSPRGKTCSKAQHALISVSGVVAPESRTTSDGAALPTFLVGGVQILHQSDIDSYRAVMRKLIKHSGLQMSVPVNSVLQQLAVARKRVHGDCTTDESPAKAAKRNEAGAERPGSNVVALMVAEQHGPNDAQEIILQNHMNRGYELERMALAARAEFEGARQAHGALQSSRQSRC